jgi:hypothetical protein
MSETRSSEPFDVQAWASTLPGSWSSLWGPWGLGAAASIPAELSASVLNDAATRLSWLVHRSARNRPTRVQRNEFTALTAPAWESALFDDGRFGKIDVRLLVTAGIRNSEFERAHVLHLSDAAVRDASRLAAAHLSQLWSSSRPLPTIGADPFASPLAAYPAAARALQELGEAIRTRRTQRITWEPVIATPAALLADEEDLKYTPNLVLSALTDAVDTVHAARGLRDLGRPIELTLQLLESILATGRTFAGPNYRISNGAVETRWPFTPTRSGGVNFSTTDEVDRILRER